MITIEDAHAWLNKYDQSHISASSESLIDQVMQALGEGHADEARGLLQQLYDLAFHLREEKEVNEIMIESGHISFLLNDLAEAESILMDSVSRVWSDPHRRAVVQWMLGCVQWQSLPTRQLALIAWQNSISDLERLATEAGLTSEQHGWYQNTGALMQKSLLEAMKQAGSYVDVDEKPSGKTNEKGTSVISGIADETTRYPKPIAGKPDSTPRSPEPSAISSFDILQLFTISEEIPAGDFGPSGIDPFPIGTVEIDRLTINGNPYSIHSTRGRKIINLPLDQKFNVVKVKGDSMNQENITEKDYVLLRKVDAPANGDIVMAEIVGIDSHATLKRYSKEKNNITLKPNSSNPAHKPFVFKKINDGFYIRGVVVAVLKPI
jgi:hypothetical protein